MWSELYETAAFTPRPELAAALGRLGGMGVAEVRAVWVELGFRCRWPGRAAAVERIRQRVMQRHDTHARVVNFGV